MNRLPHKHAATIKAWADGAQIQFKNPCRGVTQDQTPKWVDYTSTSSPAWLDHIEYRVKPPPHKWQKEMDAAREDKTIQWRLSTTDWKDWPTAKLALTHMKSWNDLRYEFRIKPEPKILTCQINLIPHRNLNLIYGGHQTDNLELTFEDGKLINAKVLA